MKTAEDIESYLMKLGIPYEQMKPGLWILRPDGQENLAVSMAGGVLVFRLKVMDCPKSNKEALYRTLLSLNTNDMVHGAFGLEQEAVVIVHALELENLDFNEFQAVVDDMSMAVAKHYPTLSKYHDSQHSPAPATSAPVA
jgi:hypothetical protein